MEDENMVNDMHEQNVDAQDEAEIVLSEDDQDDSESAQDDSESHEEAAKPQQSREENSAIAHVRKQANAEIQRLKAELEFERQAKSERINEVVSTAFKGYINPYTEKPIETEQDYEDYQKTYREDMLSQVGLSKDYIEQMIANNPVVKQAQAVLASQENQRAKIQFDLKMAEISKIDPNIKTVEDLQAMPSIDQFNFYVIQKKYDIVDAFKLANQGTPRKPNKAETKDHLIKLGGQEGGGAERDIPASELTYWKDSFPNDKPSELRARYNRALKRQGE